MNTPKAVIGILAGLAAVALAAQPGRAESAAENYRLYCVQCHGGDGSGGGINNTAGGLAVSPRDHTNAKEMSKLSDMDLRLSVARGGDAVGKSELMPPWGDSLTPTEIDDLVRYLRTLCACEERKIRATAQRN